ncbi:hypothetical protein SLEP1_g32162 [Rubroshorea leprosula]|uniref:Secreted protein n=1 Tax=Rubroshorea leprosula TaxID=152421 RepID=A0AAV5KCP9_9ROSI|nr:hypothetical protein SLEP1_g32162 [Rubroshorea leprosula]
MFCLLHVINCIPLHCFSSFTPHLKSCGCDQHPRHVDPLNITAMACPALPLCPLAITEAERGMPRLLKRVRAVFEKFLSLSSLFLLLL